jgi:hypothetical protein
VQLGNGVAGRVELSTNPDRIGERVAGGIELSANEAVVIASTGSPPQ